MILPIIAYGAPILRQRSGEVSPEHSRLPLLIANMWQTLDAAGGVGLAAPQIGQAIRLFVADSAREMLQLSDREKRTAPDFPGIRQVFINPVPLAWSTEMLSGPEGCLSIPGISEPVQRPAWITFRYWDEAFREHTHTFHGFTARVLSHEYDHLEGRLYLDYLSPLRRRLLQNRLRQVTTGKIQPPYPMQFGK